MKKIMIVDDEQRVLHSFARNLTQAGYEVFTASNGEEALLLYQKEQPHLSFVDLKMPQMDGLTLLQKIRELYAEAEVIVVTGHGSMDTAIEALRMGAADFLTKPVAQNALDVALQRSQQRLALKEKLHETLYQLQSYATELETRNAELDAFAHTVAHTLKTPLSVLIGSAQLLQESNAILSPEDRAHSLDAIMRNSKKMNRIFEELLLLTGVRKIRVTPKPLQMRDIVERVLQRLAPLIQEAGATVEIATTWPVAQGYAPWIEEVWVNYLTNALKYGGTPPHIELGASPPDEAPPRFWCKDEGPGISEKEQKHLFVPFTRINQTSRPGYGLGLSIVLSIVEKLGGEAGVESRPQEGSLFWFSLPR